MFKILILGGMNNLSDDRIQYMILDRISWLRFLDFKLGETIPDRNTIWLFREKPAKAGAFEKLFQEYDEQLRAKGCEARSGQIADATVVSAPRQRMTDEERARDRKGESASQIWDKPEKARRKDVDARSTMKRARMRKSDRGGKSGEGGAGFLCEMKHGWEPLFTSKIERTLGGFGFETRFFEKLTSFDPIFGPPRPCSWPMGGLFPNSGQTRPAAIRRPRNAARRML